MNYYSSDQYLKNNFSSDEIKELKKAHLNLSLLHLCIINDLPKIKKTICDIVLELEFIIKENDTKFVFECFCKKYSDYKQCKINIVIFELGEKYVIEFNRENPDSQEVFNIQYGMMLEKLNNLNIIKAILPHYYIMYFENSLFFKNEVNNLEEIKATYITSIDNLICMSTDQKQDIAEQGIIELCRMCNNDLFFKIFIEHYAILLFDTLSLIFNELSENVQYCLAHLVNKTICLNTISVSAEIMSRFYKIKLETIPCIIVSNKIKEIHDYNITVQA